jgi:ATP-dependent Clp protease, protease subunit
MNFFYMEAYMKEVYIRFMAPVNPQSTDTLFKAIDNAIAQKMERINLLISSPGGSVFHGLSVYNYLKGAPIEVFTYNFGSVDSIGVVMFCAGKRRFSVPHARFLIHGVRFNIGGNNSFDEKQLEEYLKGLQIDQRNIAQVIADTTEKPRDKVENDMNNRTTLNPDEAKAYGLVHEIKSELFPVDANIITINELGPQPQAIPFPAGIQIPFPIGAPIGFTVPTIEGFSQSQDLQFIS